MVLKDGRDAKDEHRPIYSCNRCRFRQKRIQIKGSEAVGVL